MVTPAFHLNEEARFAVIAAEALGTGHWTLGIEDQQTMPSDECPVPSDKWSFVQRNHAE